MKKPQFENSNSRCGAMKCITVCAIGRSHKKNIQNIHMADKKYTIGLDYGTNSVRALVVNTANGYEAGTAVWNYAHGTAGVILFRDPNLARQHPVDYLKGAEVTIKKALADARSNVRRFDPQQVVGIGVDTTGSTPLPVDRH